LRASNVNLIARSRSSSGYFRGAANGAWVRFGHLPRRYFFPLLPLLDAAGRPVVAEGVCTGGRIWLPGLPPE
jgi:hypothetical protein